MPTGGFGAIFVFSFLVSFGAVISPGPVSAAIITEAPRRGWRVGSLVALGHTSLELGMVVLIGLGLSKGLAQPAVQRIVAGAGGLMLAWLGSQYLAGILRGRYSLPQPDEAAPVRSTLSMVLLGVVTTISNPFWYAWWVTVAAGYLAQAKLAGGLAVAGFYLGHISADFAWDTSLARATQAGARWLNPRSYQVLILITGAFMLYLSVVFMKTAIAV